MASYPDNYYQEYYYSQSLFSFGSSANALGTLGDPYAYTSTWDPPYDHDDGQQHQPQHQPQHRSRPPPPTPAAVRSNTASSSSPHQYSSPPFVAPPSSPELPRSSPPPPPPAPENTPSESYLAFSCVPSTTLSSPTRKLLVLDLNGTLLLRSPRPPRSARGQHHPRPAPRHVMPRPYLPALRSYFFAPRTREWLDVMIWSSAQPHSVDDMILHAFGKDRAGLIAVWARDTLGLAEDHYYRKVQTIKDLEKPWAALVPPEQGRASPSSIASSRDASPEPEPEPTEPEPTWSGHSAATTILLDDSHAKAALQPYNHLCVHEYTRTQRNADLAALGLSLGPQHPQRVPLPALETTNGEEVPAAPHPGKGHKRKRSKEHQLEQRKQQRGEEEAEALDETLLAVIGILHAARLQSSIAGWLRAGALLQPRPESERGAEWFDDPELMREWARRGREAMRELGLVVEHGVGP